MIDIHSHILFGVDDGAETVGESLDLLKELSAQGITDVIATPHYILETSYNSSRENNLAVLSELKDAVMQTGIDINVYLGNEIHINESIAELLERGEISSLNDSEYLLVELPMSGEYSNFEDILMSLANKGHKVVLAHPERYLAFQKEPSLAIGLSEEGILLQCNLGSMAGRYGKGAKKSVINLIKQDRVFAFGSDIHRCHDEMIFAKAQNKLKKYLNERQLQRVLVSNPQKIIGKIEK